MGKLKESLPALEETGGMSIHAHAITFSQELERLFGCCFAK